MFRQPCGTTTRGSARRRLAIAAPCGGAGAPGLLPPGPIVAPGLALGPQRGKPRDGRPRCRRSRLGRPSRAPHGDHVGAPGGFARSAQRPTRTSGPAIARPKRRSLQGRNRGARARLCAGHRLRGPSISAGLAITSVKVNGADHLTNDDGYSRCRAPGTTLLNVDTSSVANSVDRDAWVADVSVNRIFPDTLEINVTEREIAAIVEVAADNAKVTQMWAIASDGMWLMEIPARDSELGATISPQIYEDADRVLHITGVPFGLTPEVGTYCADGNVNNALAILDGLSTELADQVKTVTATDAASTCLTLDNGIEIAFGTAEDIRDKERIVLQIMADNPGKVSYINVRVPDRPTWRAV